MKSCVDGASLKFPHMKLQCFMGPASYIYPFFFLLFLILFFRNGMLQEHPCAL